MRKLLLALAGAMLSFYSFADLGEIKVNSSLSQPLNATIPIIGVSEVNLSELSIGLASSTKFKNNGITFNPELGSLQFKIMNLKNSPYLQITSTRVINSPVLSILLHYQQNSDDFYRQYTLLLDPIELNDAVITKAKVSNVSVRSITKREIVLNKISSEKPIAISNNIVKPNSALTNKKNSLVMNLTSTDVIKQLNQFNSSSMIFTTVKDDSLYTVARFQQLIYPNALFSLNQIIVALGLENYLKLKPLAQVYESGTAIALALPQDVSLIQPKLADQYLLDGTLTTADKRQLLSTIAMAFDKNLKIESSDLFIGGLDKSNLIKPSIKKKFVTNSVPLMPDDNDLLGSLFQYKYYLIFVLLLISGFIFRKKITSVLVKKKILGSRENADLYSAAALASKKAQEAKNIQKSTLDFEEIRPNSEQNYDDTALNVTDELKDVVAKTTSYPESENVSNGELTNHKLIDEELMNTLESILAFDESRDDIRYKLFELYLMANRLEAANVAYSKLDAALDSDSVLRDSLRATCLQYEFIAGAVTNDLTKSQIEPIIDGNQQLNQPQQDSSEIFIPSVNDLSSQEKEQFLNQINGERTTGLELLKPIETLSFDSHAGDSDVLGISLEVEPVMSDFANDRILDFPTVSQANNISVVDDTISPSSNQGLLVDSINKFEIDNLDLNIQFDEKLNLAQMYYQIEEFAKAKEILMKLISDIHTPNEIKVHAQQLLIELKLNG